MGSTKDVLKQLIEETLKGKFKHVCNIVTSKNIDIDTNNAVKFIIAICNVCHKNYTTPKNINETDLADLVTCVLKFIQLPSNEQYDNYLQSAFYILKFLIEKENYKCIVHLRELFIPEFMPLILTEKHHSIYQSICISISNVIKQAAQLNEKKHTESILKLSYLVSDLYKRLDKETKLFEAVYYCIQVLTLLDTSLDQLLEFYQHAHSADKMEPSSYSLIINNLSLLFTYLLKKQQYISAMVCYQMTYRTLSKHFREKEFVLLSDIMIIVDWINPENINIMLPQIPESAHTSLKNYHRTYGSTKKLQSVCNFISSAAYTVLPFYKETDYWAEKMGMHLSYYQFLNDVALIMMKAPYKCCCGKCSIETNLKEALCILSTIGSLGRACISKKSEIPSSYLNEILRCLEKNIEYTTILKDNDCEKWKTYWYDVSVNLYSIGTHLYQKKVGETFVLFLRKFVQTLLEFEGFHPQIVNRTYLVSALTCIAASYFESKDYEKCMAISALSVIASESCKMDLNMYLRAKSALRENTIGDIRKVQRLTLVTVCRKYESELSAYLPKSGLVLSQRRKTELLACELRQYNAKWKSKVPMSAVLRELLAIAKTQLLADIFIEVWGDADMIVHESVPTMLQDIIGRVEEEQIEKKELILAYLYFLQHKYCQKDAILKQCDEMERTMSLTKASAQLVDGVSVDPNDECDLISSYESLKLSRYLTMIERLDQSLDLSREWILKNEIENCDKERMYKLLANIGHEYCLHNNANKSLQAWELALKIADNSLHKLQAISFIIEMSDVCKPLLKKLISEAEQDVPDLLASKNYEEVITYFLCKAEAFLYVDYKVAGYAFEKALRFSKCINSTLVQGRIQLFHHKFNTLPCHCRVKDHKEHSLVRIHEANNTINSYYSKTSYIASYGMRIFFDIYENLAKMYQELRLPREVRVYAKDAIVIAQKILLPLRTVFLLHHLAYTDIRTFRMDDGRVKMKDSADILGLTKNNHLVSAPTVTKKKEEFDGNIKILVEDFSEMMLDVPIQVSSSTWRGSPTFVFETFKMPSFLSHDNDCECFYCTCVEYHQLVVKKTYLNALFSEQENNLALARDFFCGCIKICECLIQNEDFYVKKIARKISADLVPTLRESLIEVYCEVLLEYGNFLFRNKKYAEVDHINKKILDKIEPFSMRYACLYNEILMQRLNILARTLAEPQRLETISPRKNTRDQDVKTPESKQSSVLISQTRRSPVEEVGKILPKSFKFDLSDNDEETIAKEEPKARPKDLPCINLATKTPAPDLPHLNLAMETPAPSCSKVKIYSKSTKKSSKNVLTEMPAFNEQDPNSIFTEPETPSASVKLEKMDERLASRTRLLTERLKNSSRKDVAASAAKAKDENSKSSSSSSKRSVRQNLMSQLDDADNKDKEQGLKRSARNK